MNAKRRVTKRVSRYSYRRKHKTIKVSKHRQSYWKRRKSRMESVEELQMKVNQSNQRKLGLYNTLGSIMNITAPLAAKQEQEKKQLAMEKRQFARSELMNQKAYLKSYGINVSKLKENQIRELGDLPETEAKKKAGAIFEQAEEIRKLDEFAKVKGMSEETKKAYAVMPDTIEKVKQTHSDYLEAINKYKIPVSGSSIELMKKYGVSPSKENLEKAYEAQKTKTVSGFKSVLYNLSRLEKENEPKPEPAKITESILPKPMPLDKNAIIDREWDKLMYLVNFDKERTGKLPDKDSVKVWLDRNKGKPLESASIELFKNTPPYKSFFGGVSVPKSNQQPKGVTKDELKELKDSLFKSEDRMNNYLRQIKGETNAAFDSVVQDLRKKAAVRKDKSYLSAAIELQQKQKEFKRRLK